VTALVHALLRRREDPHPVLGLLVLTVAASACFGAAVGAYQTGLQILFAAVKMPVYFLGTLGISFAAMHLFAARDLRAGRTFAVALETVALTAVVLAALAPVEALVSLSCPRPSHRAYSFLVLLLTGSVGAAGICGVARAYRRLGSVRLTAAWVLLYQFVGAQLAWLLRPWVNDGLSGQPFLPLRENMHGNFYEAVFRALQGLLG
jgi:hypothetical protein